MEKVGLGSAFRVLGVLFAAVILLGSLLLAEPPEGFHAAMAPAASGGQGSGADLNRGQWYAPGPSTGWWRCLPAAWWPE
ncbi:MAG: hypothetical protein ACLT5P_05270, partial [Flavonifractor plautii]